MRPYISLVLFFISFAPLFFYWWLINSHLPRNWDELVQLDWDINSFWLLASIISLIIFAVIIFNLGKSSNYTININKVTQKNVEFISYITTYIFTFMGLKHQSLEEIMASIVLISFVAFVYMKSELIYSNPVLALMQYNVYEAITDSNSSIMIITNKTVQKGKNVPLVQLSKRIYLQK